MKIQYTSDLHLELYDNAIYVAGNPFKAVGDVVYREHKDNFSDNKYIEL